MARYTERLGLQIPELDDMYDISVYAGLLGELDRSMVVGTGIGAIYVLTEEEYAALPEHNPATLYAVKGENTFRLMLGELGLQTGGGFPSITDDFHRVEEHMLTGMTTSEWKLEPIDSIDISSYAGYSWSIGAWDESGITEIASNSLRLNDYIDISDIGNTLYAEAYDTLETALQNCFAAYDAQKNFISYINGWQSNKTVTILPQNTKFIRLIIARSGWTYITVSDMSWCHLVKATPIS